jgi:hypothetical protein
MNLYPQLAAAPGFTPDDDPVVEPLAHLCGHYEQPGLGCMPNDETCHICCRVAAQAADYVSPFFAVTKPVALAIMQPDSPLLPPEGAAS